MEVRHIRYTLASGRARRDVNVALRTQSGVVNTRSRARVARGNSSARPSGGRIFFPVSLLESLPLSAVAEYSRYVSASADRGLSFCDDRRRVAHTSPKTLARRCSRQGRHGHKSVAPENWRDYLAAHNRGEPGPGHHRRRLAARKIYMCDRARQSRNLQTALGVAVAAALAVDPA